jgi:hypothetical protein
MRTLALILILAVVAQPLQAGYCDMDAGQDQASAAHHMDGETDGHGCCDPGSSGSGATCKDDMNCRLCTAGVLVLPEFPRFDATPWPRPHLVALGDSRILPSHASPPYRPPIS